MGSLTLHGSKRATEIHSTNRRDQTNVRTAARSRSQPRPCDRAVAGGPSEEPAADATGDRKSGAQGGEAKKTEHDGARPLRAQGPSVATRAEEIAEEEGMLIVKQEQKVSEPVGRLKFEDSDSGNVGESAAVEEEEEVEPDVTTIETEEAGSWEESDAEPTPELVSDDGEPSPTSEDTDDVDLGMASRVQRASLDDRAERHQRRVRTSQWVQRHREEYWRSL